MENERRISASSLCVAMNQSLTGYVLAFKPTHRPQIPAGGFVAGLARFVVTELAGERPRVFRVRGFLPTNSDKENSFGDKQAHKSAMPPAA